MKRTTIILLLVLAVSIIYSQDFVGRILFAPGFGYSSHSNYEKVDDNKTPSNSSNSFSIYTPVGYFLTDRIVLGLSPVYHSRKSEYTFTNNGEEIENKFKTNQFILAIFGRHYTKLVDKLNFFAELEVGFGTGNQISEPQNSEEEIYKLTSFDLGVKPGLSLSLTDKMFLELGIGAIYYSHTKTKEKDSSDDAPVDHSSDFSIYYNSINFGVMFLF